LDKPAPKDLTGCCCAANVSTHPTWA